jgi:hypothetical protein
VSRSQIESDRLALVASLPELQLVSELPVKENPSLNLLQPVPNEQLVLWLNEFYGKEVRIAERQLLRHRDLSYVERLRLADSLPDSLIYKLVLPPWDVEQDLHERILIPSISNSAQLFMSGHYGTATALFLEDLGTDLFINSATVELAAKLGEEVAKMHRAYSYRTDELIHVGVLRSLMPLDFVDFANGLSEKLSGWKLISKSEAESLAELAGVLAMKLAGEPTTLVHGDLFAENIILRGERMFIIDWSWFTILGVPLLDLATITMKHPKNGSFDQWCNEVIEAYCFESARDTKDVKALLPFAETLHRLLFLEWLVERRGRGIMGTTVGPVDDLIPKVVNELSERLKSLRS